MYPVDNPEVYPYGITPVQDRKYYEQEAGCDQCQEEGHQAGHPYCWPTDVPEGYKAETRPILTRDSGWKRLISREVEMRELSLEEVYNHPLNVIPQEGRLYFEVQTACSECEKFGKRHDSCNPVGIPKGYRNEVGPILLMGNKGYKGYWRIISKEVTP